MKKDFQEWLEENRASIKEEFVSIQGEPFDDEDTFWFDLELNAYYDQKYQEYLEEDPRDDEGDRLYHLKDDAGEL